MKKHILCLGDSNTHGYCADPNDCADHGIRFNEEERWTCRLQKALGDEYLVTEEGLSGRTTVFVDPIHESMDALSVIYALLKSHEVIDLLIIMLGTLLNMTPVALFALVVWMYSFRHFRTSLPCHLTILFHKEINGIGGHPAFAGMMYCKEKIVITLSLLGRMDFI